MRPMVGMRLRAIQREAWLVLWKANSPVERSEKEASDHIFRVDILLSSKIDLLY